MVTNDKRGNSRVQREKDIELHTCAYIQRKAIVGYHLVAKTAVEAVFGDGAGRMSWSLLPHGWEWQWAGPFWTSVLRMSTTLKILRSFCVHSILLGEKSNYKTIFNNTIPLLFHGKRRRKERRKAGRQAVVIFFFFFKCHGFCLFLQWVSIAIRKENKILFKKRKKLAKNAHIVCPSSSPRKSSKGNGKNVDKDLCTNMWLKMKTTSGDHLNKFQNIQKIDYYAVVINYMSGFSMTW